MFLHEVFSHTIQFAVAVFWWTNIHTIPEQAIGEHLCIGGIFGGLSYILAFNFFPAFQQNLSQSMAIGASASVLAILTAIATYANFSVHLTFIGE